MKNNLNLKFDFLLHFLLDL